MVSLKTWLWVSNWYNSDLCGVFLSREQKSIRASCNSDLWIFPIISVINPYQAQSKGRNSVVWKQRNRCRLLFGLGRGAALGWRLGQGSWKATKQKKDTVHSVTFERVRSRGTTTPRMYGLLEIYKHGVTSRSIPDVLNSPYHIAEICLGRLLAPVRQKMAWRCLRDIWIYRLDEGIKHEAMPNVFFRCQFAFY